MTSNELAARGYRRISNKFGIVARVDRPDWYERSLRKHPNWKGSPRSMVADFYRRIESEDTIRVPLEVARYVPTSSHDPIGYVELEWSSELEAFMPVSTR